MHFSIKTFPPNLAQIAAHPGFPLFTSPELLKSSICLQPIGFIQPLPPVQSGCILQKGQYYLEGEKYAAKSVQIIGPETGVHINTGPALLISPISVDNLEFSFYTPRDNPYLSLQQYMQTPNQQISFTTHFSHFCGQF
jgi:hypothetical protein